MSQDYEAEEEFEDGLFADEETTGNSVQASEENDEAWKVLVIDDDADVHEVTRFVLNNFSYHSKKLRLFSAYSAEEAKSLLSQHPDAAVALVDVVMEAQDSGLELVKYIRESMDNHLLRIILRTGQPGRAPEKTVVKNYDIDDYAHKAELTSQRLVTLVTTNIRSYADMEVIESHRDVLEKMVASRTAELQGKNSELSELNSQLTALNQEKDELMSIVAHDLKNPLSVILSAAELMMSSPSETSIKEITELAEGINISAQQMFQLISNILDANAIEGEKWGITLNSTNISAIVKNVSYRYEQIAIKKSITVHYDLGNYNILGDEMGCHQVLDNLISNAIKYSPRGKTVKVIITEADDNIRCEIRDEGQGMSEEDKARLFQKFARLTPRPTGGEHSTGLGLFIVKKLVDAMHGKVWCESTLGEGTTFFVEFQRA